MNRRPHPPGLIARLLAIPWLLVFTPSGAALAVDGVVELSHAAAAAGGVTPGDTAGYPITLSKAGSYRLTTDLFVSGTNTDIVVITANDVTLDLNGFSIKCLYFGTPCAGNGTGVGVRAEAQTNVTVRNGVVRDVADAAILLGESGQVVDVRVIANGRGVKTTLGTVRDCHLSENVGIAVDGTESLVRDNFIVNNGLAWESAGGTPTAITFQGNVMTRNTNFGSGGFTSLGGNKRCDAIGLSCVFF